MNEQIEKLAELSGFKQDMLNIGIWYSPEFQKFAEKFAELIVQECMNVARQQRNPANLNYKPSERFVEDLRKHFGVEE
jgi:hypothetical protein